MTWDDRFARAEKKIQILDKAKKQSKDTYDKFTKEFEVIRRQMRDETDEGRLELLDVERDILRMRIRNAIIEIQKIEKAIREYQRISSVDKVTA